MTAEAATGIPSASLLENARFNAQVVVPNAAQGIFRRRRPAVAAATAANIDGQAIGLLEGIARSYPGTPVWIRVLTERALLLHEPDDIARALDGSPDPFASDPEPKRKGMCHFQPEALTLSRGETWRSRRGFTEAVLAEADLDGELAERIATVSGEELAHLLAGPAAIAGGQIDYDSFHRMMQRIARRLILGDGAAEDEQLSGRLEEMMSEANSMPGEPAEQLADFEQQLADYVAAAEPGSLVERFATAPADENTAQVGQLAHWLFALGDTLAINALRALVLVACHPGERELCADDELRSEAALQEAMRLWPTTTMLSRVLVREIEWRGEGVPADTQVLIVNLGGHRNRERLAYADQYSPEIWNEGGPARSERALNHFSGGPQGCPGRGLALGVGALLIEAIAARGLEPDSPKLNPEKPMPQMLDFFGAKVRVASAPSPSQAAADS